jgi:hypothetical protein
MKSTNFFVSAKILKTMTLFSLLLAASAYSARAPKNAKEPQHTENCASSTIQKQRHEKIEPHARC